MQLYHLKVRLINFVEPEAGGPLYAALPISAVEVEVQLSRNKTISCMIDQEITPEAMMAGLRKAGLQDLEDLDLSDAEWLSWLNSVPSVYVNADGDEIEEADVLAMMYEMHRDWMTEVASS